MSTSTGPDPIPTANIPDNAVVDDDPDAPTDVTPEALAQASQPQSSST